MIEMISGEEKRIVSALLKAEAEILAESRTRLLELRKARGAGLLPAIIPSKPEEKPEEKVKPPSNQEEEIKKLIDNYRALIRNFEGAAAAEDKRAIHAALARTGEKLVSLGVPNDSIKGVLGNLKLSTKKVKSIILSVIKERGMLAEHKKDSGVAPAPEELELGDIYGKEKWTTPGEERYLEKQIEEEEEEKKIAVGEAWQEERWRTPDEALPEEPPREGEMSLADIELKPDIESAAFKIFESARQKYIDESQKAIRARAERLGFVRRLLGYGAEETKELKEAKEKYEEAKIAYGRLLYEKEKEALERETIPRNYLGNPQEYREEELAKYRLKLFEELVVGEYRLLQHYRAEAFPPREKSILGKLMERWNKLDKKVRWAISASIATGIALGAGTATFGAGMFFALSYGRAAAATFIAPAAQAIWGKGIKGMEKALRIETPQSQIAKLAESAAATEEWIARINQKTKEYGDKLEALQKYETRKNIAKMLLGAATGALGVRIFGSMIDDALGLTSYSGVKLPAEIPETKTGIPAISPEASLPAPGAQAVSEAPPIASETSAIPETPSPLKPPSLKISERLAELATVKKGEGVWHAVRRQLEDQLKNDPQTFAQKYKWNFEGFSLNDPAILKDVLDRQTFEILDKNNIIQPDGTEIWIRKPGVKVFLDDNQKIRFESSENVAYETPPRNSAQILAPESVKEGGFSESSAEAAPPRQIVKEAPPAEGTEPPPAEFVSSPAEPSAEEITVERKGGGLGEDIAAEYGEKPLETFDYETRRYAGKGDLGEEIEIYSEPKGAEANAETAEISPENKQFLYYLMKELPDGEGALAEVDRLVQRINSGRMKLEEFYRFYADGTGRKNISGKMMESIKQNINLINEGGEAEAVRAKMSLAALFREIKQRSGAL